MKYLYGKFILNEFDFNFTCIQQQYDNLTTPSHIPFMQTN